MAKASKTGLAVSVVHLLHRASQNADQIFARTVGREVTPRQFAVLAAVWRSKATSQVGIVAATGIDRSSTAELVHRLVARGLLRRRRAKRDTRFYVVRLTPKGQDIFDRLLPATQTADIAILNPVTAPDRVKLLQILERIATAHPTPARDGALQRPDVDL